MQLSRLDPSEPLGAGKERSHMIERIVSLTLDILYLLTGEDHIVLKMACGRVTHSSSPCILGGCGRTPTLSRKPPSDSGSAEWNHNKKILQLTNQMIELLSGEEGAVSVMEQNYMAMAVKVEKEPVLPSQGGASDGDAPERWTGALYSQDKAETGRHHSSKMDQSQSTAGSQREEEPKGRLRWENIKSREQPLKRRSQERRNPTQRTPPGSPEVIHIQDEDSGAMDDGRRSEDGEETSGCFSPGWSPEKSPLVAVIEVGEDSGTPNPFTNAEEQLRPERLPAPPTGWEISTDGTLRSLPCEGLGPHQSLKTEGVDVEDKSPVLQELPETDPPESELHDVRKKSFTCLDCGRYFLSSEQLRSHYKVHTGEAPYSCMACATSFSSPEELGEHLKAHPPELFACSQCGKCFTIKANLIAHRRVHTGDKPFVCAECGRRFALHTSLEAHLPVHAIENPYPCLLCGKCFTTSNRLAVHQTTHAGDKTYECELCGKIFTTSGSMNRHRRTHTGEKPYVCMVCGKCFNRETNLYRHQMIHTRTPAASSLNGFTAPPTGLGYGKELAL